MECDILSKETGFSSEYPEWFVVPKATFIRPGDKFFEAGDQWCSERIKAVAIDDGDEDTTSRSITCNFDRCNRVFSNLREFETHYRTVHTFVCCQCRKHFPNDHLLEIHFEENHDPIFAVKASRGKEMRCLVIGCDERFASNTERKDHVVRRHKYPSNFRYLPRDAVPSSAKMDTSSRRSRGRGPRGVAFGSSSTRAFHQMNRPRGNTRRHIEEVNMADLEDALS